MLLSRKYNPYISNYILLYLIWELEEQPSFEFVYLIATKPFNGELVGNDVIKYVYHQEVVEQYNSQLKNECIQLANFILPKIQEVLLSLRKSYGIGNNLSDFPIRLRTKNVDDVPVHNLNVAQITDAKIHG